METYFQGLGNGNTTIRRYILYLIGAACFSLVQKVCGARDQVAIQQPLVAKSVRRDQVGAICTLTSGEAHWRTNDRICRLWVNNYRIYGTNCIHRVQDVHFHR